MTDPETDDVTGRCQCGACRYVVTGTRPAVYACHCLECQRQSASACSLSMPVERHRFKITGHLGCYTRAAFSGAKTSCYFCVACGCRLFHKSDRSPDVLTIKAGTLDRTKDIVPVANLWVSQKQAWMVLDERVPCYHTQPQDLSDWRARLIGKTSHA